MHICIGHSGKRWVGEGRKIVGAIAPFTLAQRALEVILAPATEPGFAVRGDIGAVKDAKGSLQRSASGKCNRAGLGVGVAAYATGGLRNVLPILHIALRERGTRPQQQAKAKHAAHRRASEHNLKLHLELLLMTITAADPLGDHAGEFIMTHPVPPAHRYR